MTEPQHIKLSEVAHTTGIPADILKLMVTDDLLTGAISPTRSMKPKTIPETASCRYPAERREDSPPYCTRRSDRLRLSLLARSINRRR